MILGLFQLVFVQAPAIFTGIHHGDWAWTKPPSRRPCRAALLWLRHLAVAEKLKRSKPHC